MKNTKLWSVLLAAMLLCGCVLGMLFTGAAAESTTYVVGDGYATIGEALEAAAAASWGENETLVIEFTGTDNSAVLTTAGAGKSTNLLFGQPTIFRADGTRLPITIKGTNSTKESNVISWNHGATEDAKKSFAAANAYTFENLQFSLAGVRANYYSYLYAGSGSLTFEEVVFKASADKWGNGDSVTTANSYATNLSADNFTMDAFYGWDAQKIAANKNDAGLIETSVTFGKNTCYFPGSQTSNLAVVNYSPDSWSIKVSSATSNAAKIALAKEQASAYSYKAGTLASSCAVKPVDTEAKLVVDTKYAIRDNSDELYSSKLAKGNGVGSIKGRAGTSPVAQCTVEVKSGIVGRISLDDHEVTSVPRVGDNLLIVSGGSVGAGGNGVSIRLLKTPLYGNMISQISETTATETNINWFQGTNADSFAGCFGLYKVTMTGGTLGSSGYVGLFGGCGTVNEFIGGTNAGAFYGARYVLPANAVLSDSDLPAEYRNYADTDVTVFNYLGEDFEQTGSFYGARTYANDSAYACGAPETILTVVDGAKLVGTYYGGEYTAKAETKNIVNVVKSGEISIFAGNRSGIIGRIVNYIEGGKFGRNSNGISYYGGNNEDGSVSKGIENHISGGEFTGYILGGSRSSSAPVTNSRKDAQGNALPAVYNKISGGTFAGVWGAGGSAISGDVVNDISGGEFYPYNKNYTNYPYAFTAGLRNSGSHTSGDLITNISGGIFYTRVHGGTYWSTVPAEKNAGNIELNISGGEFHAYVLANSGAGDAGDHYLNSSITIDLSENDVTLLAPVGNAALIDRGYKASKNITVSVIGGENNLVMGADSAIIASSAIGTVKLHQSEGWYAHDYFTAPAAATVSVTEENGVFGTYTLDEQVLVVKGDGASAKAATLLFDSKVGVKLLFDPAEVASYGDNFAFVLELGGKDFLSGDSAALTDEVIDGVSYKAFVANGIGLKDFGTELSLEGDALHTQTFSIYSLAQKAQTVWSGEWLELANAVVDLHEVYNLDEEASYAPESATYEATAVSRGELAAKVENPSATLLMSDAVGMQVSFTLTEAPANFKATIAGQEVPEALITIGEPDAETGKVAVSVDLFFNPKYMESSVELVLFDDNGTYFTYTASLAAMAQQLANDTNNTNADNAAALLYYVQQAVDCANL